MEREIVRPIITTTIEKLSSSEKNIINFGNTYHEKTFELSLKELAKTTFVSEATASRFIKKIGFKSYKKFALYVNNVIHEFEHKYQFNPNDSYQNIVNNILNSHRFSLENIITSENLLKLKTTITLINTKARVVLWGLGVSYQQAAELSANLSRLGINVIAFNDFHIMMPLIANLTSDDLFICFTNNALNKEIIFLLKKAKQNEATTIAITANRLMQRTCDVDLAIIYKQIHGENWFVPLSSKISQMMISDLIFQLLVNLNPLYKRAIKKSIKIIKEWETLNWTV